MVTYEGFRADFESGKDIVADAEIAYASLADSITVLERAFNCERTGKAGEPSDQEQDLLRARIALATAGLDSVAKHLCVRAIPYMAKKRHLKTIEQLEELMSQKIAKLLQDKPVKRDISDFARIILSESPFKKLVEEYAIGSVEGSFQSTDELLRSADLLDITKEFLIAQKININKAFDARNQIIHELDVDPRGDPHKRIQRIESDVIAYCGLMKDVARQMIDHVSKRIDDLNAPVV